MQAVVLLPDFGGRAKQQAELLLQRVAGIPLLLRTMVTAFRAGADEIVLICPDGVTHAIVERVMRRAATRYGVRSKAVVLGEFNPRSSTSWLRLESQLNGAALWLPWNWVTRTQFLKEPPRLEATTEEWNIPVFIGVDYANGRIMRAAASPRGVAVVSPETVVEAERFLVAHSGKVLDGIHTSFNRRLCRPFVRMLSHTLVTPNDVTCMGAIVSAHAAVAFAQGGYWWFLLGALLFYVAGLFDEMDGMLARVKFAESPSGTWIEGFADGLSYLFLFGGLTLGLQRTFGETAVAGGIFLLIGCILALIATSVGRRRATVPDRPHEYLGRFYDLLDKDAENFISRWTRKVQAFQKRGVLIIYVVIFALLGLMPVLFALAIVGAHLTWILSLYFNRRFFAAPLRNAVANTNNHATEVL